MLGACRANLGSLQETSLTMRPAPARFRLGREAQWHVEASLRGLEGLFRKPTGTLHQKLAKEGQARPRLSHCSQRLVGRRSFTLLAPPELRGVKGRASARFAVRASCWASASRRSRRRAALCRVLTPNRRPLSPQVGRTIGIAGAIGMSGRMVVRSSFWSLAP